MPMTVETSEELEKIRSVSLFGVENDIRSFPHSLPFSQLYPLCCNNIQNFVNEYYMFSDEYIHSQHDVDEILRKVGLPLFTIFKFDTDILQSLDELLVANVNNPLSLRLDSKNLAQIV